MSSFDLKKKNKTKPKKQNNNQANKKLLSKTHGLLRGQNETKINLLVIKYFTVKIRTNKMQMMDKGYNPH